VKVSKRRKALKIRFQLQSPAKIMHWILMRLSEILLPYVRADAMVEMQELTTRTENAFDPVSIVGANLFVVVCCCLKLFDVVCRYLSLFVVVPCCSRLLF
jgi:hypothetical protein